MRVCTLDGRDADLSDDLVLNLKKQLRGPLLLPGQPGYEESRTVWNGMIDRRPAMVVRCLGTSDVVAAVTFAREHNLLLCLKGGGHNIAGLATADGAMMLDFSLQRGVQVDAARRVARAQAGCLLGDVDHETQLHGLAAVLGFISLTGIAGLTLGGGFGYLTRRHGWTSDNVLGLDLVTADGRLVRASERDNADLFWALRGGGGNFGVVTGIDYVLHPVGPEIVGGLVAWPAQDAPEVLAFYASQVEQAPPELALVAIMRPAPPAPWLPPEHHGRLIVAILACHTGRPEEGARLVAPLKSFGRPLGDVLVRRPYVQMQSLLDATQPKGRRYYWKSEYLPRVESALLEKFRAHAEGIRSPHSAVILFPVGGALNTLPADHSAVGNRDARFVLNLTASWEAPDDDNAQVAWARQAWEDMRPFSTGGNYLNFQTADEGPERAQAAWGANLQRLAAIKRAWDPANVFRTNRNIRPA